MRNIILVGTALAALAVVGPAVADPHSSPNIICLIANGGGSNTSYHQSGNQTQCAVNVEAFSGNKQPVSQKQISIYSSTTQNQTAGNLSLGGSGGSEGVTQTQVAVGGSSHDASSQSQGGVNLSLDSSGKQSITQTQVSISSTHHGD